VLGHLGALVPGELDTSAGPLTDFRAPNFSSVAPPARGVVHVVEHGGENVIAAGGARRRDGSVGWKDTATDEPIVKDDFAAGKSWYRDRTGILQESTGVD